MKRVRCYDNGGTTFDRYTIIFLARNSSGRAYWYDYIGCSENPTHPQGFGQWGELAKPVIDCDKQIPFKSLPEQVKQYIANIRN